MVKNFKVYKCHSSSGFQTRAYCYPAARPHHSQIYQSPTTSLAKSLPYNYFGFNLDAMHSARIAFVEGRERLGQKQRAKFHASNNHTNFTKDLPNNYLGSKFGTMHSARIAFVEGRERLGQKQRAQFHASNAHTWKQKHRKFSNIRRLLGRFMYHLIGPDDDVEGMGCRVAYQVALQKRAAAAASRNRG